MEIICVLGECYAGKGMFIDKLKSMVDFELVSCGDIIRKKYPNVLRVDNQVMLEVLENELDYICMECDTTNVVIDNPIKDIDQAEAVLPLLEQYGEVRILWLKNQRSNTDYSKRNRSDDGNISKKIEMWKIEGPRLRDFLEKKYPIIDVKNTDSGFLII